MREIRKEITSFAHFVKKNNLTLIMIELTLRIQKWKLKFKLEKQDEEISKAVRKLKIEKSNCSLRNKDKRRKIKV